MRTLLLLEDNLERVAAFKAIVTELGADWQLRLWHDAPTMLRECPSCLPDVALISLDHDLNPQPSATADPGTGYEVARFLAGHLPLCPLIIHSTNADRAWSMHNELRFAGWTVDRVGPIGEGWVEKLWLPKARAMLANKTPREISFKIPADHDKRMQRALLSLEGLAIGDAIGETLAYRHASAPKIIAAGLAAGPWLRTDDSEMAISIAEVLQVYGYINQDALARKFAWRFDQDPERGYGKMTRIQLREIIAGSKWQDTAANAFGGQGSMGNGAAMRVAPLGAYWADNLPQLIGEADKSARVTHSHPEGIAGAIAVAAAAAAAAQLKAEPKPAPPQQFFEMVLQNVPESRVRRGIVLAAQTPANMDIEVVAKALGNGSLVTAPDTVPFCIWCAAHHLNDFVKAITVAISAGGDCDTNAAIVGGIVALSVGRENIPAKWRSNREALPFSVLS